MVARAGWPAAAAVALACAAAAHAQPDSDRRLAAELAVMRGDVRRLERPATPELHRRGLVLRLKGALSSLRLLVRRTGADDGGAVPRMRAAIEAGDLAALAGDLDRLAARFPLDLAGLLPPAATPERLAWGRALHQDACAGCHDADAADTLLPAFALDRQARAMPPEEFAARLIAGVRGTPATTLANPLSDAQLAALLAYYLAGSPDRPPPPLSAAGKEATFEIAPP